MASFRSRKREAIQFPGQSEAFHMEKIFEQRQLATSSLQRDQSMDRIETIHLHNIVA